MFKGIIFPTPFLLKQYSATDDTLFMHPLLIAILPFSGNHLKPVFLKLSLHSQLPGLYISFSICYPLEDTHRDRWVENLWNEAIYAVEYPFPQFILSSGNKEKSSLESCPGKGPRLVSDIRISVSAEYQSGLHTAKSSIVKSIPCHKKQERFGNKVLSVSTETELTDIVYDLLKLNKKLELGMSEKALVDHIFVRLEQQVQDYVEVRNPQNMVQLWVLID
ncbi:uncharacterized protein TNCV_4086401 [Trichonephila clavipes]|nr:uncharacterized protein TNCV_4086401 [Trichonephila clavipes]